MISYAQNLEDVVLNRLFRDKKNGFYIDVGASDPVELSVTKHFYDIGWSGINIEPVNSGYRKFLEQRPRDINLNLAAGTRHDFLELYEIDGFPEYSSLNMDIARAAASHVSSSIKPVRVEVQTLAAICEEYCRGFIDFLKIDTEGMEIDVIRGADWEKYRPTMVVVESSKPCSSFDPADPDKNSAWQEWEPLLLDVDYIMVYDDTLNRYYLRKEDEHLRIRFAFPINPVRDKFGFYSQVREVEVLELEKNDLISKWEVLEEEKKHLEEGGASLEKCLKTANEECESLRGALLKKEMEIADLNLKIGDLKAGRVLLEDNLKLAREECESLSKVVSEKDEELENRTSKIGELEKEEVSLKSELELKNNKCDFLSKEVAKLTRDCNWQGGELKKLRPLPVKLQNSQSELKLIKQVLREKQFREDHRIRCFLERFIPFLPWPASFSGITDSSQFGPKAASELNKTNRDAAVARKEGPKDTVKYSVLEKQFKPAVKVSAEVLECGLAFDELEDFSVFGMTGRHWQAAMKALGKDRNEKGLFFAPSVSATLFRDPGNPQAIKKPWIGIIQEPHTIPQWLAAIPGCGGSPWLFEQPAWKESLTACRGLFALSEYSAEFLRKRFPEIKVCVVTHPADLSGELWSMDQFLDNSEKKVIQPGWYMRNLHSIYELPQTQAEKVAVPFCRDWELYQQLFETEEELRKSKGLFFECMRKTASVMKDVSEADLGKMLSGNIAFVNLYESNAVDTVIECIARATPLLVNAMPAVVEYLGPEYPFYMWCYDQAAEKVDDYKLILETHEYLKNLDLKNRMEPQAFRESIMSSEVYKSAVRMDGK